MEKVIENLSKWLHTVSMVIMGVMGLLITVDVMGRKFFKSPILGTVDLTQVGLALMVFLSLAYTHLKNEHISVDFIVGKFSERVRWIFEILINIVIALIMIVVSWSLFDNAMRIYESNTVTGDLGLPLHYFVLVSMLGTVVLTLTAILLCFKYVGRVMKK